MTDERDAKAETTSEVEGDGDGHGFDADEASWVDGESLEPCTVELGLDGREIAYFDQGEGEYLVAVDTGWGWTDWVEGTAEAVAGFVAAVRAEAERLCCPTCGRRFDPAGDGGPCGCGSVLWRAPAGSSPVDVALSALAAVDGVPPVEVAAEHIRVASMAGFAIVDFDRGPFEFEWLRVDATFEPIMGALRYLVPAGVWATLHGRPVGVIPRGAAWQPARVGELVASAHDLGYQLAVVRDPLCAFVDHEHAWYGAVSVAGAHLPSRWTLTELDSPSGTVWHIVVALDGRGPPASDVEAGLLMEVAFEAADRWSELPAQDHGPWHVDIERAWGDEALAAAEGRVPAGALDRDTLAATLGEAADAVRAELARFEALVPAVIDELARRVLGRHDDRG